MDNGQWENAPATLRYVPRRDRPARPEVIDAEPAHRSGARPSRLLVPLDLGSGRAARPVVAAGQTVQAGQLLAQADENGAVDVFAPLAGKVASVNAAATIAGPEGFLVREAIELVELEDCPPLTWLHTRGDWLDQDRPTLLQELRHGGLTTHRRPVQPLGAWLDRALSKRCDILIANAIEGQPYVTAEHRLLTEHGSDVIGGLMVLAKAVGTERVMLAVDHRRTGSYRELARAARRHDIDTVALPHKYPTDADAVLVHVLTRRQVPPGGNPMDVSAAVIDPASCFAVFRWIACGQRATCARGHRLGGAGGTM